jgi:hypothetical protein
MRHALRQTYTVNVWLPLATAVGGYAIKALDDWRKERRDDRRADEQRANDLEDERRHRESDFQREVLIELQEALNDLLTASHRVVSERDKQAAQLALPWDDARATPETVERQRALFARITVLRSRVKDDDGRRLIDSATDVIASSDTTVPTGSAIGARQLLISAGDLATQFNERAGELLREKY